jgi:UDP:flavonoid glycosyltransferase YjiC (YdhE family)
MKILFVPFAPSLAHMTRCLSIAENLNSAGNSCLFAIGSEGKDFIEKAGFKTVFLPEIDSLTFKNDRGWKWLTKEYFANNLNAELKIIDTFNPDLIIFDFRFTTALAARIKSKRSISILHANALSLAINPVKTALEIISTEDSDTLPSFRDKIFKFIFPKVFKIFIKKPISKIRPILFKNNYSHINTVFDLLLGDQNFIADIPEFLPKNLVLTDNCFVVGPLTWSGWSKDDSFDFSKFDSRPLIYITMGSTVDAEPTLIKLIEALRNLSYNIIVSKGSANIEIADVPRNLYIYDYVPGNLVTSKSVLAIYHGGHETLMQVLSAGIPSLVIPVNPDQILVAKQIKKLGIGNYLKHPKSFPMEQNPLSRISISDISNEITRIIDDKKCHEKCLEMKAIMDRYIVSKEYLNLIK